RVLEISKKIGYSKGTAASVHRLGNIHYAQGRYDEAATMYQESVKISKELEDRSGIASTLWQMGQIFQEKGNYKEALRCYHNASTIFYELDSPYKDLAGQLIAALKEEIGDALFDKYYEEVIADE
ncbi:MAG: tetratricopeptide repeat protein, partial [Euryarchaeota archaeon]|nr:tetratricopeptide repeat protein [Euryarchaeota archaeon]